MHRKINIMVQKSITMKAVNFIVKDLLLDFLYWPIWWYTRGVVKAFNMMTDTIVQGNDELAIGIWMKNIFTPMFGDATWQGRLVSFFMRVVQIVGRIIAFLFWVLFAFIVFIVWFLIPIFVIYEFVFNLGLI